MANYKPVVKTISASSAVSATIIDEDITTTSWGIFLLRGSALFNNTVLRSGAVAVWSSTTPTTAPPNHLTFTDASGSYGITCKARTQLHLKFYSK